MQYPDIAGARANSWCLVARHREGSPPEIVFGDPLAILGIDASAFTEAALEAALVSPSAKAHPWNAPVDSVAYLVAASALNSRWVESSSTRAPDGALLVSTRQLRIGTYNELLAMSRLGFGGSLLGPMAHELNNLVQGLSSAEYLFRDCLENGEAVEMEDVDQLAEAVGGLKLMGAQLQGFARISPKPAEPIDFSRLFARSVNLLKSVGRMGIIEFESEIADDLPELWWQLAELDLIVLTLLANSVDACLLDDSDARVKVQARAKSTTAIELELSNSGAVLDLEQHRAPGATTKADHRHLGLGLSVALAIAAKRGATIEVLAGEGTSLRITLPIRATAEDA
ncbi:MAG: hypothetical protein GY811_26165 [Myxococcales bacterium]|nr:hypothetical protein [Myxococcales bacterium]